MAPIAYLECTRCGEHRSADTPQTVCPKDGGVLYVRYDLQTVKKSFTRESLAGRPATLWRYADVLPDVAPITLGEGFTPMLPSREYPGVYIKDEGLNPTASFKARGMSVAVSMARHYGLRKLAAPSAGNAASALACYAAAGGLEAHIFMPRDVPIANRIECESFGAHVTLVDGLISDCARIMRERMDAEFSTASWFDMSTLKEPFRVEGKKTMGYEIAEQLNWRLPDGVIYPTGGGVGLIGMWKAFEEMEALGWIGSERPKMVCVQATGCAPVAKAFAEGASSCEFWKDAETISSGLRVPKPYGDLLILKIVRESHGTVVTATDDQMMDAFRRWARVEGVFAAPEGAASLAAYQELLAAGFFKAEEKVVLFNTGSGLKYLDTIQQARMPKRPAARHIGGIIGPY